MRRQIATLVVLAAGSLEAQTSSSRRPQLGTLTSRDGRQVDTRPLPAAGPRAAAGLNWDLIFVPFSTKGEGFLVAGFDNQGAVLVEVTGGPDVVWKNGSFVELQRPPLPSGWNPETTTHMRGMGPGGQVVGILGLYLFQIGNEGDQSDQYPYIWPKASWPPVQLGPFNGHPTAINATGSWVGYQSLIGAFIQRTNGATVPLKSAPVTGERATSAHAISDNGWVAGAFGAEPPIAARWNRNGVGVKLEENAVATAVAPSGATAGARGTGKGYEWLPDVSAYFNTSLKIVGPRARKWSKTLVGSEVGPAHSDSSASWVTDMNARERVVGVWLSSPTGPASFWTQRGSTAEVLPLASASLKGKPFVNDCGSIAFGMVNASGVRGIGILTRLPCEATAIEP